MREFLRLGLRATSARDPREMNLTKKEATEYLAETRKLGAFYKEPFRDHLPDVKRYMEMKRQTESEGGDIFDESFAEKRKDVADSLKKVELRPEDLAAIAERLIGVARRIRSLQKEISRIEKRLHVASARDMKALAEEAHRRGGARPRGEVRRDGRGARRASSCGCTRPARRSCSATRPSSRTRSRTSSPWRTRSSAAGSR